MNPPPSPMTSPYLLLTCGPSYATVDDVRRLTNFSTGEFGTVLAEAFAAHGWRVVVCRGEAATYPPPVNDAIEVQEFGTNPQLESLLGRLAAEPNTARPDLFLHCAALSDFDVASVQPVEGEGSAHPDPNARKLTSEAAGWVLRLRRVAKTLPKLPALFPNTKIIGWKYAVDGGRHDAIDAGKQQLEGVGTAGCLLNGAAWGDGYGLLLPDGEVLPFSTKQEVADHLAKQFRPPALMEAS